MPHGTAVLEDRPNKREVDSQLCRKWYAAAFQGKRRVTVSRSNVREKGIRTSTTRECENAIL